MQPARAVSDGKPLSPRQIKAGWTGQRRFARKAFLTKLRPEEIQEIEEILVLFRSMETLQTVFKDIVVVRVSRHLLKRHCVR